MPRFGRTFPIHPNVGQRQALAFIAPNQTISPPVATASASALVPVPQLRVSPAAATASASSLVPVPALTIPAPVATAAASSPVPVPQLKVLPPAATAAASSPTPSLLVGIVVPVATASANSPPPVPQLVVLPPAATSSASALVPIVTTAPVVAPPAATASASAPVPTITVTVLAPAATAAASSPVPVPQVKVLPPAASASASAPVPTVSVSVLAPAATASASAPVPVPQLRVSPPAATASASALVPVVTTAPVVSPPSGTASASAPTPAVQLRVSPAAATAAASAPLPVVQLRVLVPAATASASAPVPTITVTTAAGPATTTPLTGYVYGTPASGMVTPQGDAGLVVVSLQGLATPSGSTGYPGWAFPAQDVASLGFGNQNLGGVVPTTVEGLIGRTFSGTRENQSIQTHGLGSANTAYDAGYHVYYRNIDAAVPVTHVPILWSSIASGALDVSDLQPFVDALLADSARFNAANPIIISFHHEPTVDTATQPGFPSCGTAQQRIDAFRHVRDYFDSRSATLHSKTGALLGGPAVFANVGWDRMFTNGTVNSPPAGQAYADFDPDLGSSPAPVGTSYYELVGSDVYNPIDAPGVLRYGVYAGTLLNGIRAVAVAKGKDWMIGEMGCEDGATAADHVNKAAWLDSIRVYLDGQGASSPGVCRYLLSTIKADASNYNVDSSAESTAAWQRLGHDVYYS